MPAWRDRQGQVRLNKELADATALQVPCGTCLGCRTTRAQHWALRCHLESLEHEHTCITTLTYDDAYLPPTLEKRTMQLWLKRLRKASQKKIRYFACGEYGERQGRPHYHAILFGLPHDSDKIDTTWGLGLTHTDNVSIAAINYVTNYTVKKLGWPTASKEERLDPETGELYTWQPPFQLMSRGGRHGLGIGSKAKQHYQSWRLYAINNGAKLSVPRYYKQTYKDNATPTEQEETEYQKYKYALTSHETTQPQLETQERIHYARQKLNSAHRRYD